MVDGEKSIKRIRVYKEDWDFINENFVGASNADKFHRLVENIKKILNLVEMYKDVAEMYRQENRKLQDLVVRQSQEITVLREMLEKCMDKDKRNNDKFRFSWLKKN